MNKFFILSTLILTMVFSSFFFMIYVASSQGSDSFCIDQGYDYSPYYGEYADYKNEDYGRIICHKKYVEGEEDKVFNVTYNHLYIFKTINDVKGEVTE